LIDGSQAAEPESPHLKSAPKRDFGCRGTNVKHKVDRRNFLGASAAAGLSACMGGRLWATPTAKSIPNPICVFIKYLQSLSYDQLADSVADIGFDGVEATVRKGGYISPEKAEDELPKLAEALGRRGLKIMIAATDLLRADDPNSRRMLRAAASVGVPMYRLGQYRYDLKQSVMNQLAEIKPQLASLAELNREVGIQGLYENHSGADMVGAAVWDIYDLMKDIPTGQLALAFDIRHAAIEAGLAWPATYNAMRSRIAAVYVKDFDWKGRAAEHVPLGQGRIDPRFFKMLKRDNFKGPISLHVEYVRDGGVQDNLAALRRDFATLKGWLQS
jgi:sugar phosphate isomerase/epimerase